MTTPGPCVNNENSTLQDGDGANPAMQTPEAIFPYSIGQYIGQRYHSATCVNSSCTPDSKGVVCVPSGAQNPFGCDTHGTMVLKEIDGVAPTTGTGTKTVINLGFPSSFDFTLYDVVPYDTGTADRIPGPGNPRGGINLEQFFAANGWTCKNAQAIKDLKDYGFVPIPTCGLTS